MYFPDLIGVSSVLFLLRIHCSSSVSNAPALLNPERLNAGSPGCTVQPSFFNVNLDEDPYYRWDHVIAAYPNLREESLELIKYDLISYSVDCVAHNEEHSRHLTPK